MKLGSKEEVILAHLQHRADASVKEIAALTGLKQHVVRYCIAELLEREVIQRRSYINLYPLGYTKQAFFFTLSSGSKRLRSQLLEFLIASPQVAYVAEVGGAYEYKVDICGRQLQDFVAFLDRLNAKFGDILRSKAFANLVQLADFPLRVESVKNDALTMGIRDRQVTIDALDHRILCRLSAIGSRSYREIAQELGVATSTLEYRLQQLKQKRVLVGTRYLINKSALNLQSFFHLIYAKGLNIQVRDRLYQFCRRDPHVDYFVQCVASWDYEIGTTVESAQESISLVQGLFENFGKWIEEAQTLPLFRYHKVSNYPFAESSEPRSERRSWCSPLPA